MWRRSRIMDGSGAAHWRCSSSYVAGNRLQSAEAYRIEGCVTAALRGPHRDAVPKMPWSGLSPNLPFEHAYEMGTSGYRTGSASCWQPSRWPRTEAWTRGRSHSEGSQKLQLSTTRAPTSLKQTNDSLPPSAKPACQISVDRNDTVTEVLSLGPLPALGWMSVLAPLAGSICSNSLPMLRIARHRMRRQRPELRHAMKPWEPPNTSGGPFGKGRVAIIVEAVSRPKRAV